VRERESQDVLNTLTQAPIWGPRPDFCNCQASCKFCNMARSIWWEGGSVVWNCCWSSPAQTFSYLDVSILRLPQTGIAISPYLYPPGTG
jgi:hypothetical protein